MATFQTNQQSACEFEIFNRLNTAVMPGNFLDKFANVGNKLRVFNYPQESSLGEKDLPQICVIDWMNEDEYFAGALQGNGSDDDRWALGNLNMKTSCTLNLVLQNSRLAGLTRMSATAKPGLADWARAIMDVIQTKTDQVTKDANLNGTCKQPCKISVKDNGCKDVVWACMLEIKYFPTPTLSGTRSDLVPVSTFTANS